MFEYFKYIWIRQIASKEGGGIRIKTKFIYIDNKLSKSHTHCVDKLGGGAFLKNKAFVTSSYGMASSLWTIKRGESHLFLESGLSNRKTRASNLKWNKIPC